ncbi:auxin-binding protein ABP20-like [Spinacia oleracea]|uniref:Germin-like protein n=1 Tax=Spinacia oleracea TaxID=3562 RepID=A0A9R0KAZ0_SPIOL|nr:auxin-binding protein ABP20-like [Spinacia oleracea]
MNNLVDFFMFTLFVSLSQEIELDFCVGDTTLPRGPKEFSCNKDYSNVTAHDFIFTGFRHESFTANLFRSNVTLGFVDNFPDFNGLDNSMARLDFAVGGVIPVHSTSEVIILTRGSIIVGFIDASNNAFYKRLEDGDVMIFPQTMLHFQINVGRTPSTAIVSLNGANPVVQFATTSL